MYEEDTIAAISTAAGQGGIGIVRLSGPGSLEIAKRIFRSQDSAEITNSPPRTMLYGRAVDPACQETLDEVLLCHMPAPKSYTKEDVVEVHCHGGPMPLSSVLKAALKCGARLALPGEFTLRAFLNGRIDLVKAEAVMDIIAARSERAKRAAASQLEGALSAELNRIRDLLASVLAHVEASIDFPEEDIEPGEMSSLVKRTGEALGAIEALGATFGEGRLLREGVKTAIAGKPNVGKSSLLNALLSRQRAIVTPMPGTTRDTIEETIVINGVAHVVMDTAGIRTSADEAEHEGVKRSLQAIRDADVVLMLLDASQPVGAEDEEILRELSGRQALLVLNKIDQALRGDVLSRARQSGCGVVSISAKTGQGLDKLKTALYELSAAGVETAESGAIVTNRRHAGALRQAGVSASEALGLLKSSTPLEVAAVELRAALDALGRITGAVSPEDILERIFSEFCIGK